MSADLLLSARSALRCFFSAPAAATHATRHTPRPARSLVSIPSARWHAGRASRFSLPYWCWGCCLHFCTQPKCAPRRNLNHHSVWALSCHHSTVRNQMTLHSSTRIVPLYFVATDGAEAEERSRDGALVMARNASGSGVASLTRVRRRETHKPSIALMTRVIPLLPARSVLSQIRVLSRCPSPLSPTQPLVLLLRISKRQLMRGSLPGGRRMCQQIKVRNPQAISMDEC